VFPLLMYRAWGNAQAVSQIYFAVGLISLATALMVPSITRLLSRRKVYLLATALYTLAAGFGMLQGKWTTVALLLAVTAAAISFVCFNSFVLEHIDKSAFSRLETQRLLYGGWGWVIGPVLGVWLLSVSGEAPFVLLGMASVAMWVLIARTPLGEGRVLSAADGGVRRTHPWALLHRFFTQPRLVLGWLIPLVRSCGWWIYFVYVGIFALENGLGAQVGGMASSIANLGLFCTPLMLRWMRKRSVRQAVRAGCLGAALCYLAATGLAHWPWATVASLLVGTFFLVLLDACGALPFMMAVKPSERTEMSAVYSSFRDVSGIVSPGLAWLVLQFAPVPAIFAVGACGLVVVGHLAGRLHPDLGVPGAERRRRTAA
jgi:MFS family permease